jgi:flagellar basal-body rod protein FlgF
VERGTYTASSGGLLESRRLEVIANNLANVNTVGFKATRLVSRQQEFADTLASTIEGIPERARNDQNHTPGVVDIATYTDFTPGPVRNTEAPLDVALVKNNQFFVVQTEDGERLTRAGNFTINSQGQLSTQDGQIVLGEGGPIAITSPSPKISSTGTIVSGKEILGKLRVVEVDKLDSLVREEGVRFKAGPDANPRIINTNVVPQSLEMPNVSVVGAMVEMISTQRSFEGYSKSVQTIQELNETNLRTIR